MACFVVERHKHLLTTPLLLSDIIFHNRIAAREPALIPQAIKYPLGRMALFTVTTLIIQKPLINLLGKWIQFGRRTGAVRR